MSVEACPAASELSVPHFVVPGAKALDLDRTLTQVPACTDRIISVSDAFGISEQAIRGAQNAHSGGRDPLRYIQDTLSPGEFMDWGQRYIDLRDPAITYPDTHDFMDALRAAPALPNVGVTYGTNALLQVIKVAGSGCKLYIEILDHTDKGPHLANWWHNGAANFTGYDSEGEPVGVYHAESVELVDDNDECMENLPAHYTGARLVRAGEKRKAGQEGPVPEHLRDRVRTISGLGEVCIPQDVRPAGCSPVVYTAGQLPISESFSPVYPNGNAYPGILITPDKTFVELKTTLDALYA